MGLYFYFHAKITRLKQINEWGLHLKQFRVTDLAIRTKDEMLPSTIYALPMIITVGLIAYTATQYSSMPTMIRHIGDRMVRQMPLARKHLSL